MKVESKGSADAHLAAVRTSCGHLPAAEEYVMVHHPAFRVNKKPFVVLGMEEATRGPTLSVNLGRDAQSTLLGEARFSRTPYIGQHGWVTLAFDKLRDGELEMLVTESYRRVANKKQLTALDGDPPVAQVRPRARRSKSAAAPGDTAPVRRKPRNDAAKRR